MMKLAIIMITNIKTISAMDLSVHNEVVDISYKRLPKGNVLAGISWSVVSSPAYEALLSTLRLVYSFITKKFSDYGVWLLVGNSAWQPDTRIVRYRKLWSALEIRGVKVSHTWHTQEIMHESEGKLKFFGATQLSELSVESTVSALLEEPCTYLIALPSEVWPKDVLKAGWSGNLKDDHVVIEFLFESDGLLIKRFGEFDDREKGLIAVGPLKVIKHIL